MLGFTTQLGRYDVAGLFDDVLQPTAAPAQTARKGGLFDDVLGNSPTFGNVSAGSSSTESAASPTPGLDQLLVSGQISPKDYAFTRSLIGTQPQRAERGLQPSLSDQIADRNRVRELVGIEPIDMPEPGSLGQLFARGVVAIPDLAANVVRLPGNIADAASRAAGYNPTGPQGPLRRITNALSDVLSEPARKADQAEYGVPSVSGGDLVSALGLSDQRDQYGDVIPQSLLQRAGTLGRFVVEQGVRSAPEMAAAVATLPAYIAGRANQIAENRAANDARVGDVNLADLALGGVAAPVEALLERATTLRLNPLGGEVGGTLAKVLGRIGKEGAIQGGAGGVEELAPYVAEHVGTQQGVSPQGALGTFLGGLVAEGGLGTAVQGVKEAGQAARPRIPEPIPQEAGPMPEQAAALPEPLTQNLPREASPGAVASTSEQLRQPVEDQNAPAPEAPPVEQRADVLEQRRLAELRARRRSGDITPDETTELLDLADRDRLSAKVAGRRLRGVQTMEARNEAEAAGSLKPVQAFADADNFKAVNDRLGHDVGDSVIRNMGELFAQELGYGNVFHRGGDEFVLQADSPEQLDAAMTRVRDTLGRATLRATLEDGSTVEQRGVGFSYGSGPTIQEAESAQFADKEARKQAGLRFDRGAASGEQIATEPVPIRREAGAAGEEASAAGVDVAAAQPVAAEEVAVGTKGAAVAARRALEGREPILKDAVRSNPDTLNKAFETLGSDPNKGAEVVAKLSRAGTEGISLDDEAVLLVHMSDLRQQRDAAAERIADPNLSEAAKAAATQEWGELEGRLNQAEQAANVGGREWGRFGQFRQRMLRDDFTLEAIERKERARTGKPLSPKDQAVIKVYAEKIAAAQKRADAAQARMAEVESIAAYDSLLKSMQEALRAPRQRPTLERLREAANESRAALAAMGSVPSRQKQSGAIINPAELLFHYSRIGAYHVLNGATTFADWVGAMRSDLGGRLDAVKDRLPQIFQASKLQAEKPVKPGASPAEVAAKIQGAPTPKDVRAVAEAHIRAGLRGEGPVLEATAKSLGMDVADVRQLFVQSAPRGPRTIDEAKTHLRELRQQLQSEATGRRQEQARAQREAEAPTEEERFQAARGNALRKQIAELERRIKAGDFIRAAPKPPRALNAANEKAQFELSQAKEEFLRHQFEADLKARPPLRKLFGDVGQGFNLARALMTSLDLSGVLRQGGFITYGHPVRAARALGPSLKAFASAQAEHTAKSEILQRPNAPLYKKYGLELTGIGGGPLSQIEEAYASRWLERIPGWAGGGLVRGSGRAYATFLNKLRADSFDAMAAALSKGDKPTPEEAKAIANYINVATGRGKIGASENAGEVLNTVFFAPRLVASRFQLLAGQPLYGGTVRTRNLITQDYARFLSGVAVAIGLAAFMKDPDDDTPLLELDPRSSDFGKLRFGQTFLDPLAGLAQVTTVFSRLASGETKTSKGVKPLRANYTLTDLRRALGEQIDPHKLSKEGGLPFGSGDAADVITRFLRTKLAPVPGAIVNTLSGENVIGQQVTPLQTAAELITPMSFNSLLDIMEAQGVERGTAITLLGLLGMGVQHRETKEEKTARLARSESKSTAAGAP